MRKTITSSDVGQRVPPKLKPRRSRGGFDIRSRVGTSSNLASPGRDDRSRSVSGKLDNAGTKR